MTQRVCQEIVHTRPKPRRVLVLGSTGMVGRSWLQLLAKKQIDHTGVSRPEFDLTDPESIARCISDEYDLVVNAAAWTDVDGAEDDEPGALRANAHALQEIAQHCKAINATLITYSTDYVFSGNATSPYRVDAPIDPINAYGRSKAEGELKLARSGASHILIRTSWVYAPWGSNFVRTIRSLAHTRDELSVVNDQQGNPTSAQHLASASLELYHKGAQGVWHLSDEDECTWFDLAAEIIRYSKIDCAINACTSDKFPRPAARPAYSTLDLSDSTKLIGELGTWKTHLHAVLDQLSSSS